ncbi:MAG: decarboxylating 6-phosphogluconate dehydrogenase [Deltaproteobacteria bacterium]|nr:decarboxylating 6-phosphogluconate dehydrogenase [Deltaproteobacteria bacterium]
MELGMIGLGRMGANMAERLLKGGHRVVGYARTRDKVEYIVKKGGAGASSLEEITKLLKPPRVIWLMVPAGEAVEETIKGLLSCVAKNDLIVDGGNSYYKDSIRRGLMLKEKGIHYVDAGVSGGIWGLKEGYSIMVGGEKPAVDRLIPLIKTLAPAEDKGWGHVGPGGAGHFVKMVHNGIEYGMMQAYAEGFSLMRHKEGFNMDLHQIAEIWRHGSVVRSWLLDLTADALSQDPDFKAIKPYVADSGEGRWTVSEAIDLNVPAPVITLSLLQRLRSRDLESFSDKLIAVMRDKFGGHGIKKEE